MINRYYSDKLAKLIKPNKVLVIYGPRQVGKTTLVNNFLSNYSGKVYKSTGENSQLRRVLESSDFSQIIPFFSSYDLIFIDEAQKINNIGQGLKIIVDQIPGIKVIATGSSSFDLSNQIGEPLVGRQNIIKLYPLSVSELMAQYGSAYPYEQINNLLVYGSYPESIMAKSFQNKINIISQICDSYLLKDILEIESIKKSKKLYDLLKLIAFQIGSEVSLQEIGAQLEISKNTVAKYLDLLEKTFVLYNLRPYFFNQRKAISKKSKYYFYDLGIRNSIIGNFNPVSSRNDVGALWENFLVIERLKKQAYKPIYSNNYFWRTWEKHEVDWVEMRDGKLYGYEFKWGAKTKIKTKKKSIWLLSYPKEAAFELVNQNNYLNFIT